MYYLDENDDTFKPVQFLLKNKKNSEIIAEMGKGLQDREEYEQRLQTYGKNLTDIPMKSDLKIIIDEILSPFYIFQVAYKFSPNQIIGFQLHSLGIL